MLLKRAVQFEEKIRKDFSHTTGPFRANLLLCNAVHIAQVGASEFWRWGATEEAREDFKLFRDDLEKTRQDLANILARIDELLTEE